MLTQRKPHTIKHKALQLIAFAIALTLFIVHPAHAGGNKITQPIGVTAPDPIPDQKWMRTSNGEEETFVVHMEGFGLIGTYTKKGDAPKQSKVEYISKGMPAKVWAQNDTMTTDPTGEGLGYMMSYAAGLAAQKNNINEIYISSLSETGGKALAKGLGVKNYMNNTVEIDGQKLVYPHILSVKTMLEKANEKISLKKWTQI